MSRSDSAEYETLRPEGHDGIFHSKRNAQLFAESWALNYIQNLDGINRLEPFATLPSSFSRMKDLEVSRDYITRMKNDERIDSLKCHYLLGNVKGTPWSLTIHRVNIYTFPVITTKVEEMVVEQEVEEEREIEKEVTVVVPGLFRNGSKVERVKEKVKMTVKKPVTIQTKVDVTSKGRSVNSSDVLTISLVKTKMAEQTSHIEREQALLEATEFAKSFADTKTAKMIFAVSDSEVPYKVSELKASTPEEFSSYHPPEKKRGRRLPESNPKVDIKPQVNIRRATSTLGVKTNVGASLVGLGDDIIRRRNQMFLSKDKK